MSPYRLHAIRRFPLTFVRLLWMRIFNGVHASCSAYIGAGGRCRNFGGRVYLARKVWLEDGFTINLSNGGQVNIGENVFINSGFFVSCRSGVGIGNNVLIANNVSIFDHDHKFSGPNLICRQGFVSDPVYIGDNTWIGCGAIILKGVTIGSGCVIGAGAVVVKDIPDNTIAHGVPARHVGERQSIHCN